MLKNVPSSQDRCVVWVSINNSFISWSWAPTESRIDRLLLGWRQDKTVDTLGLDLIRNMQWPCLVFRMALDSVAADTDNLNEKPPIQWAVTTIASHAIASFCLPWVEPSSKLIYLYVGSRLLYFFLTLHCTASLYISPRLIALEFIASM